jgi:hypothetical protein
MKRILLIAIAGLILAGCAVIPTYDDVMVQPQNLYPSPSAGKSLIYFYKEDSFLGAAAYIRQGDKTIGALSLEGYFFREVDPGEHWLCADAADGFLPVKIYLSLKTEAGQTYYVLMSGNFSLFYAFPSLQAVPPEVGRAAVRKLKYTTLR